MIKKPIIMIKHHHPFYAFKDHPILINIKEAFCSLGRDLEAERRDLRALGIDNLPVESLGRYLETGRKN